MRGVRSTGADGSAAAPELPHFPYHPDPVRTGSVVAADVRCLGCDQVRPYTYAGPVYSTAQLDDPLCPWCIADGTAARRFDAEFTAAPQDHRGHLPAAAIDEVVSRTPGFSGWQEERWLDHCGDVAAFLGPAGAAELAQFRSSPEHRDEVRDQQREQLGTVQRQPVPGRRHHRELGVG